MQSAHAAQSSYLNLITVYDVLCMSIWFGVAENVNVVRRVLTGDVQLQAEPAGCRRLSLNRSPKFYHVTLVFTISILAKRKGYFKTIILTLTLAFIPTLTPTLKYLDNSKLTLQNDECKPWQIQEPFTL